jgi:hypothetical protein
VIEYLRLAFATGLVLLPGRLVARSLGHRSVSATVVWALGCIFVAWTLVFVVHGTIWLAAGALAVIAIVARLAVRRPARRLAKRPTGGWLVFALGVVLGMLMWSVAGVVGGDGLFHEARVRKLVDLGNLHLKTVDEFKDGGLHPGYAFPLWHGFDALVAKISGLDPGVVITHEASILVPLTCLVAWEAGVAVFGSPGGGFAVLAGQLGLYLFAAGHGGSYASLALPATAAKQLILPAAIALFFGYLETRRRSLLAAIAVALGALAFVHVTYAVFLLIPLAGYVVVRFAEWRASALALAAAVAPTAAVVLWLRPIVDQTQTYNPDGATLAAELAHFADELRIWSTHDFRIQAGLVSRSGAVSVAALALVPLAVFAARRRWSAFVLGGSVSILALMLVPTLFVHFTEVVSLSQSRRAGGFIPFAFAFAGGLMLLSRSALLVTAALPAGIALQLLWPGDFAYGLHHAGPAAVAWFALVGGGIAIVAGSFYRRRVVAERPGRAAVAAFLFVIPIAVHGFSHWSPIYPTDIYALSPQISQELRAVPARSVVIAPVRMSYRISAAAPVYVVASPAVHVADTKANRPYERIRDVQHWLATGDPAIPRKYGATWAVRHGRLYRLPG